MPGESGDVSKTLEQQRRDSVKDIPGIDPETAKQRLQALGYGEQMWDSLVHQDLGSHFIRALIHIAQGSEIRRLEDVYKELYPDHAPPGNRENGIKSFLSSSLKKKESKNPLPFEKPNKNRF